MASSKSSEAEALALHFAEHRDDPTKSSPSLIAQMEHRRALVSFWDIQPGSRVLEIGCGQGDTTIVLADAVGEYGHVDAVDPGALDYGRLSNSHSFHLYSSTTGRPHDE
jgi:ubiquinone/menaquinone biosynthesis C-methylase UbiE